MTVAVAVLLALGLNALISIAIQIPRPHDAGIGHSYLAHAADSSFPSDHATVLFAAAWAFALSGRRRSAWLFAAIGLTVSWARIYLGVHYPLDIFGGGLSGLAGALLSRGLMALAGGRLLAIAEAVYRRLFSVPIRAGWVQA
jgi:undecaprenyl-diphosphatase